ncbi:MAG: DsbA family protein [Opitutaceae bacterium]|nr:DsbA family protein [Opitutaceae bacterium]
MSSPVTVTYYLEVISSWCHWVEPTWHRLQEAYAGRVNFAWKVALMSPGDFPVSESQCRWFYRRSGTIMRSPYALNSGWFEAGREGHYEAPNLVAEAGRDFIGAADERIRLALNHAAVRDGRKIGDLAIASEVAAAAVGISAAALRAAAESVAVRARVDASTAEFHAHQISQRPAFILGNTIGDKVVVSGLTRYETLAAAIDGLLIDAEAYASHAAHFGGPPAT